MPRRDEQRRPFDVGVVEHAHRVPEAAGDVDVHHPQTAGSHRIPVGHRHDGDFLHTEDVLKASIMHERGVERQLGRPRIAEDVSDPRRVQNLEKNFDAGHCEFLLPPRSRRRRSSLAADSRRCQSPLRHDPRCSSSTPLRHVFGPRIFSDASSSRFRFRKDRVQV